MNPNNKIQMMAIVRGAISIPILAVGKGWLAVDKPPGMSVHNEPGRDLCSLVSAYIQEEEAIRRRLDSDPNFGVNPVHRLDKETSGVILLAVRREVFRFFSNQFESRQVKKRYIAILHGRLESPEGSVSGSSGSPGGTWRWALAGSSGGRRDPEGAGHRQDSQTRYRVLDHSPHYTMVEIELLSGRTHQIRRHAKLAGHPVVGDARYGSTRAVNYLKRNCGFDRLALHASALTILTPGGKAPGDIEIIESQKVPGQMRELFENDTAAGPQA